MPSRASVQRARRKAHGWGSWARERRCGRRLQSLCMLTALLSLPVEELLSPEAGAVDFGPRTDHEEQGGSDSDRDCNRRGADKNA